MVGSRTVLAVPGRCLRLSIAFEDGMPLDITGPRDGLIPSFFVLLNSWGYPVVE